MLRGKAIDTKVANQWMNYLHMFSWWAYRCSVTFSLRGFGSCLTELSYSQAASLKRVASIWDCRISVSIFTVASCARACLAAVAPA